MCVTVLFKMDNSFPVFQIYVFQLPIILRPFGNMEQDTDFHSQMVSL